MTKKHFIKLADYLKDTDGYCEEFSDKQIEHLANFCHSCNSKFMKDRFVDYINDKTGPNGGRIKS